MTKQSDRFLAKELIKKGLLATQKAEECLKAVDNSSLPLQRYLIEQRLVSEEQILAVLAGAMNLSFVSLRNFEVDRAVIARIPVRFAWYYKFMPVSIKDKTVVVACYSPFDIKFQDEIRIHLGLEPQIVLAKEAEILDALNKYYGLAADTLARMAKDASADEVPVEEGGKGMSDLEEGADEATITRLVNQILLEAYKKRATDIHIEPYRRTVRVRYRIDGSLVDANVPPAVKSFFPSIISRVKIMANLSIVEKRLPQDGSAVVKTKEGKLDLRLSTIPTPHGESLVIRILPTNVMLLSLEKLGLDKENLEVFRTLVARPHGIVLVTGPTGSGKSTTLYACLNEINSADRKIITLEDPLEYEMEGITQIQVNPNVHLDFATGLRSVLRHDPDIIMVGEIRDLETAEIAIRTALTGHLVFSTLHTNDSASGITRLVEMGLEPFLVASSIEAFVAQRLLRIICPHCKAEDTNQPAGIKAQIASSLKIKDMESIKIFVGRGCEVCNQTGFYGRTAIYEILVMDEDIRTAVLEKQRADQIKKIAMAKGMLTLRQNGWQKVLAGLTTPAEVLNLTVNDESLDELVTDNQPPPPAGIPRVVNAEILKKEDDTNSRVYERVSKRIGIRYAIVRQDPKEPVKLFTEKIEHSSLTRDISAGGLSFVCGYALPVETILDVHIQLDKKEKSVDCLARVCRVEDDDLTSMFNIVVYYLDISSADRARLNQFVRVHQSEEKPPS